MRAFIPLSAAALLTAACQHAPPLPGASPALTETAAGEAPVYVVAVCGDCHAVTAEAISPNPEAPGFADIANSPGLTRETLVAFLSDAHNYPMQMDVNLDRADIEVIADHILTLKSDDYHRTPS